MDDSRVAEFWWTPGYEDWQDAQKTYRRITRAYLYDAIVIGAGLALAAVGVGQGSKVFLFLGIAIVTYYLLYLWILRPQALRRTWRRSPGLRDGVHGTVDADAGVTLDHRDTTTTIGWTAIARVEETDRQFLLFLSALNNRSFVQLPKGAVLDGPSVDRLRTVLNDRVPRPAAR